MLIQFVIRSGAKISELLENKGHAFRLQHRAPISHLHMQMRSGSVATVSEQGQRITRVHPIMHPHLDASILQVRISHITVGSDLQDPRRPALAHPSPTSCHCAPNRRDANPHSVPP